MKRNPPPRIDYIKATDGDVAIVHLRGRNTGKVVLLDAADVDFLDSLGLSFSWQILPRGHVQAPCSRSPRNWVSVARVLLNTDRNQELVYINGRKDNLRRSNLSLGPSLRAHHRDRAYLKEQNIL